MSEHTSEKDALRRAAIMAVHALEAREADPSVEQYVDAVLSVIPPVECGGCACAAEHDGDYGASGHAGSCPPHTCVIPPERAES